MKLEGKTALVTGAGSGMGRAIATLFASEGANVVVAEINEETGRKITKDILDRGQQALFVKTNVAIEADVKAAINTAVNSFGKLDIVINNAGLGANHPSWEEVIRVNAQGVYYGCKYGVEAMLKGGGGLSACGSPGGLRSKLLSLRTQAGAIVSTSTAWAVYDEDDEASLKLKQAMKEYSADWSQYLVGLVKDSGTAYLLSKRLVNHITRVFAVEYAKCNIRINAIAPGWVTTEGMGRPLTESEEAYRRHAAVMPMNRLAAPEEIARIVLFLVSDDASFITGAILAIDGGYSASQKI